MVKEKKTRKHMFDKLSQSNISFLMYAYQTQNEDIPMFVWETIKIIEVKTENFSAKQISAALYFVNMQHSMVWRWRGCTCIITH